jgi:hypothetical protein
MDLQGGWLRVSKLYMRRDYVSGLQNNACAVLDSGNAGLPSDTTVRIERQLPLGVKGSTFQKSPLDLTQILHVWKDVWIHSKIKCVFKFGLEVNNY